MLRRCDPFDMDSRGSTAKTSQPNNAPGGERAAVDTALLERGAFLDALGALRSRCHQNRERLTLVMIELGRPPDGAGWPPASAGAAVELLRSVLTVGRDPHDLVSHDRGNSFFLALPRLVVEDARRVVEECRRRLADLSEGHRTGPTSVAVGCAESTVGFIESERQLIQRTRIALEHAKTLRRDRFVDWKEMCVGATAAPKSRLLSMHGVTQWVERLQQQIRSTCTESTRALVAAVEAKDPHTEAHSLTVASYAAAIGRRIGLDDDIVERIRSAGLLHDVGKIGVPDAILTKPGPLTEAEFDAVRRHPAIALDILKHVSFLTDERPFILHHHERFDGTGYPCGLAGREIPIGARIIAVADALDTMLSPRTYKRPYTLDQVKDELRRNAGRQFDPAVVDVALGWMDEGPDEFTVASLQNRSSQRTMTADRRAIVPPVGVSGAVRATSASVGVETNE